MQTLNSDRVTSQSDARTTQSDWKVRIDPGQADRWRSEGIWTDETVSTLARRLAAQDPQRVTHVDGTVRLTAAQLLDQAGRLATSLSNRGLSSGDVVAFQLPNWHEAVIIDVAASMLGLIVCPIVSIYRDVEVELILSDCRARAFFLAAEFRNFDFATMLERIRPRLPNLTLVSGVRVGDRQADGLPEADRFEQLIDASVPPLREDSKTDPDAIKLVLYTSGTTGRPKAVLHTHNTFTRATRMWARSCGLVEGDTTLMPSPVTHVTGFGFGVEQPLLCGTRAVFMQRWIAADALRLIDAEQIVATVSATPFLQELLDTAKTSGNSLPSLRFFGCGGAAVPPELIRRVRSILPNCWAVRGYGSSEAPAISAGVPGPEFSALAADTDGLVLDFEVRILDVDGKQVPLGSEGEICAQGPSLFVGYADPLHNQEAFDKDGFFHTGDLGYLTKDNALVITGRIKDLINRGGEKVSAKEIEDILYTHPDVQEAVVVAMPHARLGETVCAYVVPCAEKTVTLDSVVQAMQAANVARQKFPERVVVVSELPKTASGKVRKDLLRADIRQRVS